MVTIKSYTDLEQSKKLSEILPLESADMKWFFWKEEIDAPKTPTFGYSKTAAESYKNTEAIYLPCWSLADLLGVLPNENMLVKTTDGEYYCLAKDVMTKHYNNPVDACVNMIEKLNELNLL